MSQCQIGRREAVSSAAKLVLLSSLFGPAQVFAAEGNLKGRFFDYPVEGLAYRASRSGLSGNTASDGSFAYRAGDEISFSLGGIILGQAKGSAWITPWDLVPDAEQDLGSNRLINIAMLLQSLGATGDIEEGILLTPSIHNGVAKYKAQLSLDQPSSQMFKTLSETIVPELQRAGSLAPASGGPMKNADETRLRRARSIEMVRNQLRRTKAGIMRMTDVKIPMNDFNERTNPDAYLLGTLFVPVGPGVPARVPVVMNLGLYGKDRIFGSICSPEQLQTQEVVDDRYRSGNPAHQLYENHETVDTFRWVPSGYAVLRVDEAGMGRSPGKLNPWSHETTSNYVDAIEWAGRQSWCNGNVGTIGISYYAMTQWHAAANLGENSALKAAIPWEGGVDAYRDDIYPGGLFLEDFFRMWSFQNSRNRCGPPASMDFYETWGNHPFYDPEIWDELRADVSRIRVPFMSAAGLDNMALHPRGNVMAFRQAPSKHKFLRLNTGSHILPFYEEEGVADQMAFFDYWLKGIDTGILQRPRVKMAVRTGDHREYFWAYADQFPLPKTRYTKFYLDARPEPGGFKVDGTMPVYQLHPSRDVVTGSRNPKKAAVKDEAVATYSAVVQPITQVRGPPPPKWIKPQKPNTYGISFATPPLEETMYLIGYGKLVVWVSSSTTDMDIHLSLRVYDENGNQLIYPTDDDERIDKPEKPPIQQGRLKVSHRKLDPRASNFFQPVHTHLKADHQPLVPDEAVPVEVEFWPMTAEIRRGCRIVLDVQPYHGEGHAWPHKYGDYNTGTNSVYTGGMHASYLQLPLVDKPQPAKESERWSTT